MKKNTSKEKEFTWADLKKAIARMPVAQLKKRVTIWTDDERCYHINQVEVLREDYLHDGDEGCAPRSALKQGVTKEEWEEQQEFGDHYLVHGKGTRIINAD